MTWIVRNLWLIPALPVFAAGISALLPQRSRRPAAGLAIGSMGVSFLLALFAFANALRTPGHQIFIYSTGYMEHDENFTRFFCFLALFAGAMLGVVVANSLLLLFMCWEIVGLTSYLLICFWFQNPRAAAAAKK